MQSGEIKTGSQEAEISLSNFYSPDGLHPERRSSSGGLYNVMFKPYVLELLNSRACGRLKTTTCWKNLHFLTTNRDLHYLAKLPISRALFTSRIPQFQEWLLNLRKGPSAAKGIMKKMHKIPAVQRLIAAPNVRKLINCPCWKNGWVQS